MKKLIEKARAKAAAAVDRQKALAALIEGNLFGYAAGGFIHHADSVGGAPTMRRTSVTTAGRTSRNPSMVSSVTP